jgi:peptidoglycan/xylan/chitin deacetylase (PgdA/CDA1 family)
VTVKHASPTVVTLGFDDGLASQYDHRSILQAHNAPVTYFINSGNVGKAGYFTWAQIADLAGAGNEIAGHTLDHPDLTTLSSADQQREVCDDRNALLAHGYEARNFAYPFGAWNAGVESVVSGCGYSTARTTGGTDYPEGPEYAETLPPKNPLTLRAIEPRLTTTLATYEDIVEKARFSGGGWVNLVQHDVCDDPCNGAVDYAMSATTLDQLLTWLAQQPGVTVKTEAQALGQAPDTTAPTVSLTAPAAGSTVSGTTTITANANDNVAVARVDFYVNGAVLGSDATAPTVSLTAPTSGASVRGNVTISASASDNVGVTLVDFLVNGVVVGSDATAPFAVVWGSATAGSSATLTARAHDAAGNVKTSAARTVTVLH